MTNPLPLASVTRACALLCFVATGCPKEEAEPSSAPPDGERGDARTDDVDGAAPQEVLDASAEGSLQSESLDAGEAMSAAASDAGTPDAMLATADADAGILSDGGAQVVSDQFAPAGFMACDLREVEWEDQVYSFEEFCPEGPDCGDVLIVDLASVVFGDTDEDGQEEAWVITNREEVFSDGTNVVSQGASVYVRDDACEVYQHDLVESDGGGWLDIEVVSGGADVTVGFFDGPVTYFYRWEDGCLRVQDE